MKLIKLGLVLVTLISILSMDANSQNIKNYENAWKQVNTHIEKGLPKSALEEVKKIYTLAKKENQDAQIIKSLVYITALQQENREDNEVFSVKELETEIASANSSGKTAVSAILQSLLAEVYWNYFQQNRWNLYNRTATTAFQKDDLRTWSTNDFHEKVGDLYLASIKNEKTLQQTKLKAFDAIIEKGNVRHLRPTLFDLLVHRALDYFETDERYLTKPAFAFEISEPEAFAPAADFVKTKFTTTDTISLQFKALQVYQRLLSFHLNDKTPDALIDADTRRLNFVKSKSVHTNKGELYFNALSQLAKQYENVPAADQAWYLMARHHVELAGDYEPFGDTTHRFEKVKAKEICEKIIAQKDSSEGWVNCYNLLQAITTPSFQFHLEQVNVPGQPFRALVEYTNVPKLHFRLIRSNEKIKDLLDDLHDKESRESLLNIKPLRSWEQALPAVNDLQEHSTEIKIDGLAPGEYILIAGNDEQFSKENTLLGSRLFYVSNISFIHNNDDYFVLHRDNGQPLANAMVQVWENVYNYQQSKYILSKERTYRTDANGYFKKQVKQDNTTGRNVYRNFFLEISHQDDRLFIDEPINDYYYYPGDSEEPGKKTSTVFLFADRGLYRPGQTVYFKGIVLDRIRTEKKAWANTGYTTTIHLRDANYQDIDSIKVKTNEFGSFSGKFQLPQSGLNGSFSIFTKKDNGIAQFNVEDYKRPKFFVDYEPVKGTYQLNDTISVTGVATAYAGNAIDGAQVKYRVVRQPRFLYPWHFRRGWLPPSNPMEITQGVAVTDADGKFVVNFKAIPDLTIDKQLTPVFDFTVYADITDINGETRSGQKSITVGYTSLLLKTQIPSSISTDSLKSFYIRTENMNGEFEQSSINVVISKLRAENRLIRDRFWERPDQFTMTREEYIQNFPHDEYDNETEPANWPVDKVSYEKKDTTSANGRWTVDWKKPEPGFYSITITTTDKNGVAIKDVRYVEIFDPGSKKLNSTRYLVASDAKAVEPGQSTSVELGTSADKVFLIHQVKRDAETGLRAVSSANTGSGYHFYRLDDEKKNFSFNPKEEDRGGFGASWIFVKHNRVHQNSQVIRVPWSNKELNIEYASYRDKTLPGSTENWTIKISGNKNEKLAAEMLASMYDASLDQFYPFQWYKPGIWPEYYNRLNWNSQDNFTSVRSEQEYIYRERKELKKSYDRLLSNIWHLGGTGYYENVRNLSLQKRAAAAPVAAQEELKATNATADSVSFDTAVTYSPTANEAGENKPADNIQVRRNFQETAFFYPDLKTDSTGTISFTFQAPEALTRWKFQALAHTTEGALGYSSKEIVTQKQLMVQPNPPRFLREGDRMELSAKIVNMTDKEFTGQAELQLFDAATNQMVDGWFSNMAPTQFFTVGAGRSESVSFPIVVPFQFNRALVWRIVARAGDHSDGEENILPVLTNRMLVTESLPLQLTNNNSGTFSFDKLLKSGESETIQHHALTLEYSSNPAWYAVQSLPYIMEYPYDCVEQTWNRYYANSIASFIVGSSPRIKQVFEKWKTSDTAALVSNLQKNEELKSVLLEETPWVLQAKTETEQKKNIALLFDLVRMGNELSSSYEKLKQMQSQNGGFVWFKGAPDDRYMTQYIITGIGHLIKIGAIAQGQKPKLDDILATAIPYLDRKIKQDYDELVKHKTDLTKYQPSYTIIQYLYTRSFFTEIPVDQASGKAYDYFRSRAQATWNKKNKYMQGMLALALHRTNDQKTPASILASLKETAVSSKELGMYWKDTRRGWFWYEAPIERQALLIEAFQEITKDQKTVNELKTWLLRNKQTNSWESTKATAEACYALLLQGSDWLNAEPVVRIQLGNETISSTDAGQEAGTGYIKSSWEPKDIRPEMGQVSVRIENTTPNQPPGYGAVYWQYFEDLDKITTASTPLKLSKKLFIEKNSDRGPVLTPVNEGDFLKVGDKIKVRIELSVDRDMEYVHMKDLRASALEPVNVLSGYKWQGGLGYYESTRDAATHFFFNQLRKGVYVFEYPLFVTHTGSFSNGITSIQCMYAPEFTAHSEGIRINVE